MKGENKPELLRSADAPERAQDGRLGLALRLAFRERVPEPQGLVAGARDDRLSVGRASEIEDLWARRKGGRRQGCFGRRDDEKKKANLREKCDRRAGRPAA